MDLKSLMSGDLEGFSEQMQQMGTQGGGFDPMAMFQGESQVHSIFLAPVSPQFEAARTEFLESGSGALTALVQQLQQQGLEPAQAQAQCVALLKATQAMLVCIQSNDQGLQAQSHMFFGTFEDGFLDHVAQNDPKNAAVLRPLLETLRTQLSQISAGEVHVHQSYVCAEPDEDQTAREYWCDLAEQLIEGLDQGIMPGQHQGLSDLAYWIASALPASLADSVDSPASESASNVDTDSADDTELDGDELMLLTRCALIYGDLEAAIRGLGQILEDYEPEADDLLPLCEELTTIGIQQGQGQMAEAIFAQYEAAFTAIFSQTSYEIAALRFRLLVSAGVAVEILMPAAQRLHDADASAFRHDLNKEPVWRISTKPTGTLLDTADAADYIDRSLHFMGKRIDNGGIPCYRDGDDISIPEIALESWKQIIDRFKLLD